MKCCMVASPFPVFALRAAPRNSCISGGLGMLAESTQTTEQSQIIGLDCHAVVIIFVSSAHMDFAFRIIFSWPNGAAAERRAEGPSVLAACSAGVGGRTRGPL